jgi:2,4-dienoyl-CoA reductase (NADPH2)
LPTESAGPLLQRLGDAGVALHVAHHLIVPEDPAQPVALRPVFGDGAIPVEPALIVWHQPRAAQDGLLRGAGVSDSVTAIGDCVTPRRIGHAIAEGYRIGASV